MKGKMLYVVSGLSVFVPLFGCQALRYDTKASIEVASWIGLETGGKNLSSASTVGSNFANVNPLVYTCWIEEIDGDLPDYVKDMEVDSVYVEIENKDTLRHVELNLYVAEDSLTCDDLSTATLMATVNLTPGEQLIIDGQNSANYFTNLGPAADIARDGQFWAYVKASGTDHVHVELTGYTFYVTLSIGIW
jgi:hypothetical protein